MGGKKGLPLKKRRDIGREKEWVLNNAVTWKTACFQNKRKPGGRNCPRNVDELKRAES